MTETRMSLEDWLDDLCVRFIINLPEEDLSSVPRICFQVEEAQWFYEDFIRPLDPSLPSMSLRSFCLRIFQHCPLLSVFSQGDHMRAFEEFLTYKTRVPVRGAIMLNREMDAVVLVKGWKKGANWSFPRGKINKDEDDLDCAVREVYEETGYDIQAAGLVPKGEEVKYIEVTMREQHMRLYVFRDVPMETHFEPRTRKEISKIQWYRLSELPAFRKKGQQQAQDGAQAAVNANKFYMVAPFLGPLKKWVIQQKKKDAQKAVSSQFLAPTYLQDTMTEEETGTDRENRHISQSKSNYQSRATPATPGLGTMEGATAALHRLLKIQPPTQGLQLGSATQSPATKDSGEALLALLQGKPRAPHLNDQSSHPPPHTPLDHTITSAPVPLTPHHHQPPRHPAIPFSNQPPPPLFPFYHNQGTQPYQPRLQQFIQSEEYPSFQQSRVLDQKFPPPQPHTYGQRPDQYQQLRHPQPLPPHVQRVVFTGDQPHGPVVPQRPAHSSSEIQLPHTGGSSVQQPQFTNTHGPIISPSISQTPPKLTSHSLALLNAFKSRDQVTSGVDATGDLPLRRFTQVPEDLGDKPENLPGRLNPAEMSGHEVTRYQTQDLTTKPGSSEEHRSSLLSMFKNPTSSAVLSNTTPEVVTPASLFNPYENNPSGPGHLFQSPVAQGVRTSNNSRQAPSIPKGASPFKPVSILTRPIQVNDPLVADPLSISLGNPKPQRNGRVRQNLSPKPEKGVPEAEAQPFQPQILKRPQEFKPILPTELAAASPAGFANLSLQSSLERRPSQPAEHKQALLSLFGKPPVAPPQHFDEPQGGQIGERSHGGGHLTARSRIGSLTSVTGDSGLSPRRGSQTPTSPANTAFLLGYLDGITRKNGL